VWRVISCRWGIYDAGLVTIFIFTQFLFLVPLTLVVLKDISARKDFVSWSAPETALVP
jgi:hypothetical protein